MLTIFLRRVGGSGVFVHGVYWKVIESSKRPAVFSLLWYKSSLWTKDFIQSPNTALESSFGGMHFCGMLWPASSLLKPPIRGTGWNWPDKRSFSGVSHMKWLSMTGPVGPCHLSTIWLVSFVLRQFIISRWSSVLQLRFLAVFLVFWTTVSTDWNANGESSTPLSIIALWKSPSDRGDNKWSPTLAPPELTPNAVTLSGSPPNAFIFSRIHFRACTWSNIPQFPRASASPVVIKPNGPSRYWTITKTTPNRGKTSPGVVCRAVVP